MSFIKADKKQSGYSDDAVEKRFQVLLYKSGYNLTIPSRFGSFLAQGTE